MASFLLVSAAIAGAFISYNVYRLLLNIFYARRAGFPYVVIPYDQNAFVWIVMSVPLRPFLKRTLPKWIWNRVALTIYGWEFHEGFAPYDRWAKHTGNGRTLAYATAGNFEFNTWDPEITVEILRRPRDFQEPSFNTLFMGRFGQNVLTANGEHWARQRKVIAGVINERISKRIFNETVQQTTGLLEDVLQHGKRDSAETYGMFDMMKKLTMHVLSGAGMGQSVPWEKVTETPHTGYRTTYMEAVKTVTEGVAGPIILPQWFFDYYPKSLPGYEYMKSLGHAVREFPLHTRDLLDGERKRLAEQSGESRGNIMSQLIQSADGNKAGKGLTEEEMVGNLFIFTAAGFDTTANTLSYALATLARRPEWQRWMIEEIDEIMPESLEGELDYATIYPKAIRVMAVMLETLRLFTPLVHIPKCAHGTQIIQTSTGTHTIPAGTTCYIDAVALHRDPSLWRDLNPDSSEKEDTSARHDEDAFRPTRWINPPGSAQPLFQPPKGSYVPWSMGPRNCPGMKMAQVEFTATFLTLFRKHRIEAVAIEIPEQGGSNLGVRTESQAEVFDRLDARIQDSLSILTLQMNGVYDIDKAGAEHNGLKLRIRRR